ncbi:hypothetical protein HNV11_23230 [Spirosoma taeanense]|uniref:Lipoprotein n=2 Tax=Spirosoma taeanense TaxID=2735870 RepID=A0A6M5YES0_9BACT|nr:hypothetical protein HNV11_23230 [Spirosoma taeanense]
MPLLTAGLLVVLLASCGPSYVGVRTAPPYGPAPGYYGPRPYYGYNYGYRPYAYRRPPVIIERRTYVTPRYRYNNAPNARAGVPNGGYRGNNYNNGRSRGPR